MLGKLFKRATVERPDEVARLDPNQDEKRLRQILSEGTDELKTAALQRLGDPAAAWSLRLAESTSEALGHTVGEWLQMHYHAREFTPDEPLAGFTQADSFEHLYALDQALAERWLAVQSEARCIQLALRARTAAGRQFVADQLRTRDALQALQSGARGRDNSLYRLARSRLQALREAETAAQERNRHLEKVRAGLKRLAEGTWDPLLGARFRHLQEEIERLAPEPEEKAHLQPLEEQVSARLAQIQAEPEAVEAAAPEAETEIETGSTDPAPEPPAAAPGPSAETEPEPVARETNNKPQTDTADKASERPATTLSDTEKQAIAKARVLLRRGHTAVRGGHLRQARGIWRSLEETLSLTPEERHSGLWSDARDYQTELEKLADWQDFAVVPKMQELIGLMRDLTERSMHPKDKADAVQALQAQWRKLSQGGGGRHQALWEEFHQWAEQAFEPCREYFAEQDELHAVNLAQRQELIGQLQVYLDTNDWHNPDWAEVEKVLRLAARDWRQFTPVKPMDHRATDRRYRALVERIRAQLHTEYDRNRLTRENIIARAESLRAEEDLTQATEQLKELQREWQAAGRTHRKDDHRLWREFRAICDEVFGRRDQASQSRRQAEDQRLTAANRLINAMREAASGDADSIGAGLDNLAAWEAEFEACKPLPRNRYQAVLADFNNARHALQHAHEQRRQAQDRVRWQALFQRVRSLGELEARQHAGQADIELARQVQHVWEDGTPLPAVADIMDARLQAALAVSSTPAPPAHPDNADELNRLTLRLEILAGVEVPAEARALRMEVQVEMLSETLGQGAAQDARNQALRAWLRTPARLPEAAYLALVERVETAWLAESATG